MESRDENPHREDNYLKERAFFNQVREYFHKVYKAPDASRMPIIDTTGVANEIKEVLRSRNIQQKLIGELVLDVGQGEGNCLDAGKVPTPFPQEPFPSYSTNRSSTACCRSVAGRIIGNCNNC